MKEKGRWIYIENNFETEEIHRNGIKNINELRPVKFTGRLTRGADERTATDVTGI